MKCCRQKTRDLTIHFNLDPLLQIYRTSKNFARQRVPNFRHAEMRAYI